MAREYWVTADSHFGHANALKFLKADGTRIRPFQSVLEMDEHMISQWNSVVKPGDYVYHLGDVTFNWRAFDGIAPRLNGAKRLILGNHDRIKGTTLANHFQKIELWKRFDDIGVIATHVPVHASSLSGKYTRNVHGHLHHQKGPSKAHLCVSVELTDYRPVNVDELDGMFKLQG